MAEETPDLVASTITTIVLTLIVASTAYCTISTLSEHDRCRQAIKAENIEAIRLTCGDMDYPDLPAEREVTR